jgi:DNA-directed RNA polymerase specialized sigma24 family protein
MPSEGGPPPVIQPPERPRPTARLDLHSLPSHQRVLVSLHYELGLSHHTLCRMSGLLPSNLRVRLFRARTALLSARRG